MFGPATLATRSYAERAEPVREHLFEREQPQGQDIPLPCSLVSGASACQTRGLYDRNIRRNCDWSGAGWARHMSSGITRELLQTTPVEEMSGWETRLFLITYPAGADGRGHSHPVPGTGYVLEGTMVSAFDDDPEEIILADRAFRTRQAFTASSATAARPSRCGL
jgi:hypothetical protein